MSAVGQDRAGYGVVAAEPTVPHQLGLHRHLLVSERLRLRRLQLGLTQKDVVVRLQRLGVDTTNKALSSLEHGAGLDVCKLPELARALECTLTYLVGLSSEPLRWEPDGGGWPGVASTATEVPLAGPVVSAAPTEPLQRDQRKQQTDGPWILGPAPDLQRLR